MVSFSSIFIPLMIFCLILSSSARPETQSEAQARAKCLETYNSTKSVEKYDECLRRLIMWRFKKTRVPITVPLCEEYFEGRWPTGSAREECIKLLGYHRYRARFDSLRALKDDAESLSGEYNYD